MRVWATILCVLGFAATSFGVDPNLVFFQKETNPGHLLVFVHGVMSSAQTAWTSSHRPGARSWPSMVAVDDQFPAHNCLDVAAVEYPSPPTGLALNIAEVATGLLARLDSLHAFNSYESIHFVTHSMGGLVIKRLMATLQSNGRLSDIRRVKTVTFLGSPANPNGFARLANILSPNEQFEGMDSPNFLTAVQGDWKGLLNARVQEAPFPRVFCAYEKLPVIKSGFFFDDELVVVPQAEAEVDSDTPALGLDCNHLDIAKPDNTDSQVYAWVRQNIYETISESQPISLVPGGTVLISALALAAPPPDSEPDPGVVERTGTELKLVRNRSGYSFGSDALVSGTSESADIRIREDAGGLSFVVLRDPCSDSQAGILDMGAGTLPQLWQAPGSGYKAGRYPVLAGHLYAVRTRLGDKFVKLRVDEVDLAERIVRISWAYQPSGSRSFVRAPRKTGL